MTTIDALGFVAAFCTTVSFLPQAVQVIRTRDTRSLSLAMYTIFTLGVALWLMYGIFRKDWAIVVANVVTFALAAIILLYKVNDEVRSKSRRIANDNDR